MPVTLVLGDRQADPWSFLDASVNFQFSGKPCLKLKRWNAIEEGT